VAQTCEGSGRYEDRDGGRCRKEGCGGVTDGDGPENARVEKESTESDDILTVRWL